MTKKSKTSTPTATGTTSTKIAKSFTASGTLDTALTALISSDALSYVKTEDGPDCAYNSKLRMVWSVHRSRKIRVYVSVTVPKIPSAVYSFILIPNAEPEGMGCQKASDSQRVKYTPIFAEYI